jgi:hypothetical protein
MDGEIPNVPHPKDFMMGVIRGEIPYVPKDAREGAREGEEEDISSFLNPSSDRMEIEIFDEGQTNNNDERQLQKNSKVYIYIEPLVIRRAICIYVLTTLSFFSPPDRADRLL